MAGRGSTSPRARADAELPRAAVAPGLVQHVDLVDPGLGRVPPLEDGDELVERPRGPCTSIRTVPPSFLTQPSSPRARAAL